MPKDVSVGFLIHKIENRMKASIDAQFRIHDLTFSQSQVLFQLKKHEDCLSQRRLQELLNVSHPTMVGLIKRLEANGYVETCLDEKDKRNKIVKATKKAKEFHMDMERSRKQNNKDMLKGLNKEEEKMLLSFLETVYKNLEEKQ
ncbi:MAG: MarR family transcriptional regulator [Erysipelotrichaceae bacterium]|nr:MarR family transcriptional regulator [Erysipelotrichaceae bacterium]MCR4632684.1 MarR family transcriptional regulator [Erysipelotrichaceae bacterium]